MSLGFSLRASVSVWKLDGHPTQAEAVAASARTCQSYGGTILRADEDSVEAEFELMRWRHPIRSPFGGVRRATLTVRDRGLSLDITAEGESTIWVPLGAMFVGFATAGGITWHPLVVGPLVGLGIAAWYYGGSWFNLYEGVVRIRKDLRPSLGRAPNKRLEPTRRMIKE